MAQLEERRIIFTRRSSNQPSSGCSFDTSWSIHLIRDLLNQKQIFFKLLTFDSHEPVHARGHVNPLNSNVKASAVQIFHGYDDLHDGDRLLKWRKCPRDRPYVMSKLEIWEKIGNKAPGDKSKMWNIKKICGVVPSREAHRSTKLHEAELKNWTDSHEGTDGESRSGQVLVGSTEKKTQTS